MERALKVTHALPLYLISNNNTNSERQPLVHSVDQSVVTVNTIVLLSG